MSGCRRVRVAERAATIDCDVHCAPASREALFPYLSEYWREFVDGAGIMVTGLPGRLPASAPTTATAAAREQPGPGRAAAYELAEERCSILQDPRFAVLNCLTLFEAHRNPYYQAALASAVNDWLRAEWLDRDDRLRASIVVPTVDVDDAVAEIERLGDDAAVRPGPAAGPRRRALRQQALPRRSRGGGRARPRRRAARVGSARPRPTPNGFTSTYIEDYLSNQLIVQTHVLSLVSEGSSSASRR